MKNFLIVANWKLNGSINMISDFVNTLKTYLFSNNIRNEIVLVPPNVYLERIFQHINTTNVMLGSQDVDIHINGPFTGETSIVMLKEIGVKYVIVGHSERRFFHFENNQSIAQKFGLVKKLELVPILCVGENEKEKTYNHTEKVITQQLDVIFNHLGNNIFRNTVIAYEPIWAIGTGLSSNPQDVQSIHQFIKNYIQEHDVDILNKITVQYGGSVNSLNAKKFLTQPDVDGLLIGNSSLNVQEFIKIIDISNILI